MGDAKTNQTASLSPGSLAPVTGRLEMLLLLLLLSDSSGFIS